MPARLDLVSPENPPDPAVPPAPEPLVSPSASDPAPADTAPADGVASELSAVEPFAAPPEPAVTGEPALSGEPALNGEPARNSLSEWVITILLLLFLTTTQVQAFVIPSGSMEQTLLIGDHLLVDKMAYAPAGAISKYILPYRNPKRGDIIVFRYPTDIQQTFVKRCVGVPGDRIKVVDKQLYVNDVKLEEPYKYDGTDYIDSYRDDFPSSQPDESLEPGGIDMLEHHVVNGEVVVPPGNYFAMGDNRENSLDSRYWGFVPRDYIIGKPLVIYWSFDRPQDERETNWITAPEMLDLVTHFFSKTRWRRSMTLVHGYPIP